MRQIKQWALAVALLLLSLAPQSFCQAQDAGSDSFLIFTVRYKDGEFTVLSKRLVAERLKAPLPHLRRTELLTFSFEDSLGVPLGEVEIPHPAFERHEAEDPARPGSFVTVPVTLTEVDFLVRIPFKKGIKQLSIFQHTPSDPANEKKIAAVKKLVARVEMDGDTIR